MVNGKERERETNQQVSELTFDSFQYDTSLLKLQIKHIQTKLFVFISFMIIQSYLSNCLCYIFFSLIDLWTSTLHK